MGEPEVPSFPQPPSWRERVDLLVGSRPAGPRLAAGAAAVVALVVALLLVVRDRPGPPPELRLPVADSAAAPAVTGTTTTVPTTVLAHAAGAVVVPGVYRLAAGARVTDLLEAAGGPAPGADVDRLNLAAPAHRRAAGLPARRGGGRARAGGGRRAGGGWGRRRFRSPRPQHRHGRRARRAARRRPGDGRRHPGGAGPAGRVHGRRRPARRAAASATPSSPGSGTWSGCELRAYQRLRWTSSSSGIRGDCSGLGGCSAVGWPSVTPCRALVGVGQAERLPQPVLVLEGDRARGQPERAGGDHDVLGHPPDVEEPASLHRHHEHHDGGGGVDPGRGVPAGGQRVAHLGVGGEHHPGQLAVLGRPRHAPGLEDPPQVVLVDRLGRVRAGVALGDDGGVGVHGAGP